MLLSIIHPKHPKWNDDAEPDFNFVADNDAVGNVLNLLFPLLFASGLECVFADAEVGFPRGDYIVVHSHLVVEKSLSHVANVRGCLRLKPSSESGCRYTLF